MFAVLKIVSLSKEASVSTFAVFAYASSETEKLYASRLTDLLYNAIEVPLIDETFRFLSVASDALVK